MQDIIIINNNKFVPTTATTTTTLLYAGQFHNFDCCCGVSGVRGCCQGHTGVCLDFGALKRESTEFGLLLGKTPENLEPRGIFSISSLRGQFD